MEIFSMNENILKKCHMLFSIEIIRCKVIFNSSSTDSQVFIENF